jgi:DNA-directed RNA polymerase specialized sigma24 family protein
MKPQQSATNLTQSITTEVEPVKILTDKYYTEEFFVRIEPFVRTEVTKHRLSTDQAEELIQNVLVKLWLAARTRIIENPRAYVRTIIANEYYTLWRGRKLPDTLQLDDYGEISNGHVMVNISEGWDDPAYVFEERETQEDLLHITAQGLSTLPRRQRQAMVRSLFQRVDDTLLVIDALESHHVPVEKEEWPQDEKEEQSFRSSNSIARRKVAHYIEACKTMLSEKETT